MKKEPILPPLDVRSDPKTEFFMAASHQLKSPVAIVQWCLQSVLEKTDLDSSTKKLTERALLQADAMSQLLADMLRVFRIVHKGESNDQVLVPLDVNAILADVLKQCEPALTRQQVKLKMGPQENLPQALADEAYLKQAFINIIDNAIKYSPENGSVEIGASVNKGMIELKVTDHGIGIPEAEHGRLFSEFFRGELAKEKTANGTGLGLVLVKHIMESFGGSVSFTSAAGKGSTFTLRLPVQK